MSQAMTNTKRHTMTSMDSPTAWAALGRPLRLGVIGGGPGSFIGPIHRSAAVLDRRFVIVAGVLSSDPLRAVSHGAALGLDASRAYASVEQMLAAESARPAEDRIEAVAGDDAQRPPLHRLCAGAAGRSARHLRQADGQLAQPGPAPGRAGGTVPAGVLPDPQLQRLPYGAAGAGDGRGRRTGRHPHCASRVFARRYGAAGGERHAQRQAALEAEPPTQRALAGAGRYRHPCPPSGLLCEWQPRGPGLGRRRRRSTGPGV